MKTLPLLGLMALALPALPAKAEVPKAAAALSAPSGQADLESLNREHRRSLYLGVIQTLRRDGMAHAALAHLDAFDVYYPKDVEARVLRADCLTDLKDYAAAQAIYETLVAGKAVDQAEAGLGRIHALQGQWTEAADAFALAVKRRPIDSAYLNDLGFALVKAGRTEEGLFRLRQAVELAPRNPLARNNLIVALYGAGRGDEAGALVDGIADAAERDAVVAAARAAAPQPPRLELPMQPALVIQPSFVASVQTALLEAPAEALPVTTAVEPVRKARPRPASVVKASLRSEARPAPAPRAIQVPAEPPAAARSAPAIEASFERAVAICASETRSASAASVVEAALRPRGAARPVPVRPPAGLLLPRPDKIAAFADMETDVLSHPAAETGAVAWRMS